MAKRKEYAKKPSLNNRERKLLKNAADALEDIGWSLSAADVATDNFASLLKRYLFDGREKLFAGRTPTLYDVIDMIACIYGLSEDVLDAAEELKQLLEDSYRDERNDDIVDEVREYAEHLALKLKEFIDECPR